MRTVGARRRLLRSVIAPLRYLAESVTVIVDWTCAERPPKPASKPLSVETDQVSVAADTLVGAPIGNGGTSPASGMVMPTAPQIP
jgi:hypothetical protein